MEPQPLERAHFDADRLVREHPPHWHHRNKKLVFEIACATGTPFAGHIAFARWAEEQPPTELSARAAFTVRPGVFDYATGTDPLCVAWHMNFADPMLFVAYGSPLLAQDELQVAEHPILGSLRDALQASGQPPRTVDDKGRPTPITISGVQRRCVIDTRPNPKAGRPEGLYGNAFARASEEQIAAATTALSAPTLTNILAMAAPAPGSGTYRREEITDVLNTAFTGFRAARRESKRLVAGEPRAVIHTGFWGCGAFGGNRILMTILQAMAADLADVEIVFWAFDAAGIELATSAYERYVQLRDASGSVPAVVDELLRQRLAWGIPDGN